MTERTLPGRIGLAGRLRPRPRVASSEERWGYAAWSVVAVTIAIPETIAGVHDTVPWPTISETVGELEWLWSPTSILVVGFLVFVIAHAAGNPLRSAGEVAARSPRGRTAGGRLTVRPAKAAPAGNTVSPWLYFPVAMLAVIVGSVLAAIYADDRFVLGYVLYGLLAIFYLIIPTALALWHAWDVPFPTLFRTIANLERRFHFVAVLIVAGLVVLALHLAFFPWPDIARILQRQPP